MPLTTVFAKRYSKASAASRKLHERQASFVSSALLSIRQIKLSVEESHWTERIKETRDKELAMIWSSATWMSLLVIASNISPVILAGAPIYVFTLLGNTLTAPVAFTSISLFKEIQSGMSMLRITLPDLLEYRDCLRRLESYLASPEIAESVVTPAEHVSLTKAEIAWYSDHDAEEAFTLNNVSVEFPTGELSIITGKTGSGKSLLLSAIAGEVKLISGVIKRPCPNGDLDFETRTKRDWIQPGQVAYISQNPWMANTSIRENILFGLPFDAARYGHALHSCALEKDLESLADGEATLVGIKGAALSGGQRWRIALARALYSCASLLLLDDVMSAVDPEVRQWIVDKALCGDLAKGRTRILVTHHASHDSSQIIEKAAYHVEVSDRTAQVQPQNQSTAFDTKSDQRMPHAYNICASPITSKCPTGIRSLPSRNIAAKEVVRKKTSQVPQAAYMTYFKASGGISNWLLVLAAIITYEGVSLYMSQWLKVWTSPSMRGNHDDMYTSILSPGTMYITASTLECIMDSARCLVWYTIGIHASKNLSSVMVERVFGADLQWLESVSHGEILTLFGEEMDQVNDQLPHALGFVIENRFTLVTIIFSR